MSQLRHFWGDAGASEQKPHEAMRPTTDAVVRRKGRPGFGLGRWRVVMEGDCEGLKTAVRPEFFEDVLHMIAHGGGADAEGICNARGPLAQRQVLEHFSLPSAQRRCGRNVRNCV